jgi:hypothetical protein
MLWMALRVQKPSKRMDFAGGKCYKSMLKQGFHMPETCNSLGCKGTVPSELESEHLCLLHFTLNLERDCAEMRRETALGVVNPERQAEMIQSVVERGEKLASVAVSGLHLTDEIKARVLSTFLTLMNFRENFERATSRAMARTVLH